MSIQFGAPLDLSLIGDDPDDPLVLRRVTDQLLFEIRELTEQEYVDRYAKRHNVVGGTDTQRSHLWRRRQPNRRLRARLIQGVSLRSESGSEPEGVSQRE